MEVSIDEPCFAEALPLLLRKLNLDQTLGLWLFACVYNSLIQTVMMVMIFSFSFP